MILSNLLTLFCFLSNAQDPGNRDHFGMTYDHERDVLVLFGGNDTIAGKYGWRSDTWEWDGEIWNLRNVSSPGKISSMSLVYYPGINKSVMIGGINPEKGDINEVWLWDGAMWSQGPTGPGARLSPAVIYDPVSQSMLLYSGCAEADYPSDTWSFDGQEWKLISQEGPPGICRGAIFYDQIRNRIMLFGGSSGSGFNADNQMWEWSANEWVEVDQGSLRPSKRANISMAYDTRRNVAVLYGGNSSSAVLSDTWEWDGSKWREVKSVNHPGPREVYGLVYHPKLEQIILYGGRTKFAMPQGDMWLWDGVNWERK